MGAASGDTDLSLCLFLSQRLKEIDWTLLQPLSVVKKSIN